jgi:hypothetical protein
VEEKALMAALANASIVSALFPPADEPLPVGPLPSAAAGRTFPVPQLVVDRHPNRQIARAVLSTCRAMRVPALSAGNAAMGDRLDVASALAAHGLPRPLTALCTSEAAALEAVAVAKLPATLFPLDLQSSGIALLDFDAAEAIVEHRVVLGGSVAALGLIQAGAPAQTDLATVAVVDGKATALTVASGTPVSDDALHLAEAAARVLNADLVSIVLALGGQQPLVWDVQPVSEFRHALPIAGQSVAQAIAEAVALRLTAQDSDALVTDRNKSWTALTRERIPGDVIVSA